MANAIKRRDITPDIQFQKDEPDAVRLEKMRRLAQTVVDLSRRIDNIGDSTDTNGGDVNGGTA